MATSWRVIGHEPVKRVLEQQIAEDTFPHAYLFTGPEGVGKKALAREFAAKILGIDNIDAHTDVHIIDAAGAEFDIASARGLMDLLILTPLSGSRNVAIINNADQLTTPSSNALLKTLEEPSPHALIILVAGGDNVLPTVKSRCQIYRFGPLTAAQLQEFAATLPARPDEKLIELSAGLPGRLHFFIHNPEQVEPLAELVDRLDKLMTLSLAERFAAIPDLAESGDDLLRNGLRAWLFRLRQALRRQPHRFILLSAILESLRSLDQSMNRKLVLQRLFSAV